MAISYQYCEQLRTIPKSKFTLYSEDITAACPTCSKRDDLPPCDNCSVQIRLFERYVRANIPVDFWLKEMTNFKGDPKLIRYYNNINENFREYYKSGKSMCLVGNHGVGKTFFACSILKIACTKGYAALYSTVGDMVNILINGNNLTKFQGRQELMMTSFLVLDEFDSRFISSESSADLFGRILESIIRIRFQNCMPTILISNDLDPTKALGSNLGASIGSLISGFCKKITVLGADFRQNSSVNF